MTPSDAGASVVLVHGLLRSAFSMGLLAHGLSQAGYRVHTVGYPSRPYDAEGLVERYLRPVVAGCDAGRPIHVVTHSLGGILIRVYLQTHALPPGSRIVMLAPPNHGSEVADTVRDWPLYRWLMGQVGQQLGTGPGGIARRLEPVPYEVGVIAARRSLQPWFSRLFDGPNDGMVSVESARLDEMRDFIVVDHTHTLLMLSREVRGQVRHFLAEGRFRH